MRNETWVWAALGGPFEWKLALGAVPDRHEYEFLEATLLLALETIKRGMEKHEGRFSGFDGVEISEGVERVAWYGHSSASQ